MRNLNLLNLFRDSGPAVIAHHGNDGDETCGIFRIESKIDKAILTVVASCGLGWDHVSVSRTNRCPNWYEMEQIKYLFFKDNEVAMQLHVPVKDHISVHPHCLHMWRPQDIEIPLPPKETIA